LPLEIWRRLAAQDLLTEPTETGFCRFCQHFWRWLLYVVRVSERVDCSGLCGTVREYAASRYGDLALLA
jgi:hypothetical protein